jgi:hypothetical protein
MCVTGLHASKRIIDALQYAPGNTICRVECRGKIAAVLGSQALLWTGMGRIDGNLAQISGQLAHIEQTVAR